MPSNIKKNIEKFIVLVSEKMFNAQRPDKDLLKIPAKSLLYSSSSLYLGFTMLQRLEDIHSSNKKIKTLSVKNSPFLTPTSCQIKKNDEQWSLRFSKVDTLSTNFHEKLCDIFFHNPDYYLDAHYQNNWLKNKYESF